MKKAINEFDEIKSEIYWWNMGRKRLDHRGTASEYFTKRGIKVTRNDRISSVSVITGFKFEISVSSCSVILIVHGNPVRAAHEAIKTFLSMMGDKSVCKTNYLGTKVNWK